MSDAINYDDIVARLSEIPTLPLIAAKVNTLLVDPKSNSKEIAEIIKQDQAITSKVLKIINSPYYGIPGGVTDVHRACAFLGYNTLAQIVLGLSIFSLFRVKEGVSFNLREFWRHALSVAIGSEIIAKKCGYKKPEECFTAGLLHDLGKTALYAISSEKLVSISEYAIKNKITFIEAEIELKEVRHTILGGLLAQRWRLPLLLSTIIRTHHMDHEDIVRTLGDLAVPVTIISVANKISHNETIGFAGDRNKRHISDAELKLINFPVSEMNSVVEDIRIGVMNSKEFLKLV